jgi:hypothetical protein
MRARKIPAQTSPHSSPYHRREAMDRENTSKHDADNYSTGAVRSEDRKCGTKIKGLMQQMTPKKRNKQST